MNIRPARVLRGLASAFIAVFVSVLSHVAGGGGSPGAVGTALAFAFSSVVCVAFAGRSLSLLRLSISVMSSQVILHTLFTVGAASTATVAVGTMQHHGGGLLIVSDAVGGVSGDAGGAMAGGREPMLLGALTAQLCSGMCIAHLAAALVTILALRRGERAFRGLVALAGLRFRRLLRPLFVEPTPVTRVDRAEWSIVRDHHRDLGVFLQSVWRRGPPVCARFAH
ncbi:hypothetical protein B7R21_03820 [Subtercola boreus]|uniref:Uncharacterized protein n=1 Tax=Subtercola boreus TaxID=120213 RepID=A0A3E0VZJ7_9MICO|nr:hypothetical protein [Subtercola boreus]RFA15171.1 hypothetical protein B7R21_03820 [Subtercola boreus]